jgi:hypothetical protein
MDTSESTTRILVVAQCTRCGGIVDVSGPEGSSSAFAAHPEALCSCGDTASARYDKEELKRLMKAKLKDPFEKIKGELSDFQKDLEKFYAEMEDVPVVKKNDHVKYQSHDAPPIPGLRNHYGKKRRRR